jgi:putative FmdB family regulatory protein
VPRYGYHCDRCGADFELVRPMQESGAPSTCPNGHAGARRTFGGVVALGPVQELPSIEAAQARHHTAEHHHGPAHGDARPPERGTPSS